MMTLESIEDLKSELVGIKGDLQLIKSALLGDEYRNDGLIFKVSDLSDRIVKLEEHKKKLVWMVVGVSGFLSFGGVVVGLVIKLL